jgi:hypothetical protein
MREMDRRMGLLRLLVADLDARQRQGQQARDQLRGQLSRLVDFAVRANMSVPNALAALAEAEERLAQQEMTLRHLSLLRRRAQSELDALLVTRGVADAHARLAELEAQRVLLRQPPATADSPTQPPSAEPADSELAEIEAEMAELRATIEAASAAAARALTNSQNELPPPPHPSSTSSE